MRKGSVQSGMVFQDECPLVNIILGHAKWRRNVTIINPKSIYKGPISTLSISRNRTNGGETEMCTHRSSLMDSNDVRLKLLRTAAGKVNNAVLCIRMTHGLY